jgi:hypothetical protein
MHKPASICPRLRIFLKPRHSESARKPPWPHYQERLPPTSSTLTAQPKKSRFIFISFEGNYVLWEPEFSSASILAPSIFASKIFLSAKLHIQPST